MKPAIARRPTECAYCHDTINPGSDRLDDVIKTPNFYKRIHYHPNCFAIKIDAWYELHRNDVVDYKRGGGHPPSNLTVEQRDQRNTILVRLANLTRYYSARLNLQTPPNELTTDELRQFNNFSLRYKECAEQLEELGGLPPRYQDIKVPVAVIEEIENQVAVIHS